MLQVPSNISSFPDKYPQQCHCEQLGSITWQGGVVNYKTILIHTDGLSLWWRLELCGTYMCRDTMCLYYFVVQNKWNQAWVSVGYVTTINKEDGYTHHSTKFSTPQLCMCLYICNRLNSNQVSPGTTTVSEDTPLTFSTVQLYVPIMSLWPTDWSMVSTVW